MEKRSIIATIAALIGGTSLLAAAAGPICAQLSLLSPYSAFWLFAVGVAPGGLLALLLGITALLHTRAASGRTGRGLAWTSTLLGVLLLGVLLGSIGGSAGAPTIHDVTTDIETPPEFGAGARGGEGRVNGLRYPDGGSDVPELQRAAYPDLKPIEVPWEGIIAFERAREVAEDLGWEITHARKSAGRMEAKDVSKVFKFVDDMAIRITYIDYRSSLVDIRSNSRVGLGDMGANAARIRRFRDGLIERANQ
ncbi:MAG: DUF1499 domain-containing protein [bacterium]|nr:DUF1499 domain-containing protein [bacterium]